MAASLRDIEGQLTRVKTIYTQYLTISAKSNYFLPDLDRSTKPVVQTWVPRFWMDKLASHVLAILLIFLAISIAILQWIHRKERSRLYLAGPPGSIASDVSMTSSAKFGLLLNAGDTEEDLARKLQGMRFGIEHSTGQIIVEKENTLPRSNPQDVRASLLSNPAGPGPRHAMHRDSFVGLRNENRASSASSSLKPLAVGGMAPTVSSPLASARFSQTTFSPPYTPSPSASTTTFGPAMAGPTTFTSPPPSSTKMRFSAPPGPPPQLQARDSYHDPYSPNPA